MKPIVHIVLMTLVATSFYAVLVFVEANLVMDAVIVPPADVDLDEWLENFQLWGSVGIGLSLVTALLWYALGQWVFKIDHWKASGKRHIWILLFLVPVGGAVLAIAMTGQAQEGALYAYLFHVVNNLVSYYLETALFSPSSFKYSPIGAQKVRRWNLAF